MTKSQSRFHSQSLDLDLDRDRRRLCPPTHPAHRYTAHLLAHDADQSILLASLLRSAELESRAFATDMPLSRDAVYFPRAIRASAHDNTALLIHPCRPSDATAI